MDDDVAASGASVVLTAAAMTVLVGAYAWWAVARPPFSTGATVAVVGAGAIAVMLGALRRRGPTPAVPAKAAVRWAVLAGALGAWQLMAFAQQPRADHPTLSSLTNTVLATHPTRAAAFVLWLGAARELARR